LFAPYDYIGSLFSFVKNAAEIAVEIATAEYSSNENKRDRIEV